jgi:hypothetical protein
LVSILILLPNLLWMVFPPHGKPESDPVQRDGLYRVMEILEWVGRIAAFVIPFFYRIDVQSTGQVASLVVMALALLLYYAGWARYFTRGRSYALLFEPLLGIPIPLAISPIVYLLAASVLLGSWYLALAAVTLGIGHLWISYQESRHLSGYHSRSGGTDDCQEVSGKRGAPG